MAKYKYEEILEVIKNKIQTKQYKYNEPLASEADLCREFNTSRITIKKTISCLRAQGWIYSVQGKGNYIANKDENTLFHMNYSCKTIFSNGYDEAKLISCNIIKPDVYQVYNLNIAPEDKVVALKWLIYENNIPIAFDEKYLPYFAGINISEKNLEFKDFSDLVKNKISSFEIYQELQIKGVSASADIAKKLDIRPGDALALAEIKVYDQSDEPFGWGKLYVLPNKICFRAETNE